MDECQECDGTGDCDNCQGNGCDVCMERGDCPACDGTGEENGS